MSITNEQIEEMVRMIEQDKAKKAKTAAMSLADKIEMVYQLWEEIGLDEKDLAGWYRTESIMRDCGDAYDAFFASFIPDGLGVIAKLVGDHFIFTDEKDLAGWYREDKEGER